MLSQHFVQGTVTQSVVFGNKTVFLLVYNVANGLFQGEARTIKLSPGARQQVEIIGSE
jgi:hypothetical protein